jgi:hypothetical protein
MCRTPISKSLTSALLQFFEIGGIAALPALVKGEAVFWTIPIELHF